MTRIRRTMASGRPRAVLRCVLVGLLFVLPVGCATVVKAPYVVVLGTGQDAGVPQAGAFDHPGWERPDLRRTATCLALVDPRTGRQWMFEATPDFREQHRMLYEITGESSIDGIFLTHAHIGHYTGLMFLGHESMGAEGIPVHAMPRMRAFLEENGPWSQLVRYGNIDLRPVEGGVDLEAPGRMRVEPLLVPHRQEFSEVVAYVIEVEDLRLLFLPDIDSWAEWDEAGMRIEDVIASVDIAVIDGTFFANGEIPGRDMSGFPHPFISHSLERFSSLPGEEREKIVFIHLNHSNPAQYRGSRARRAVERAGMHVAEPGMMFLAWPEASGEPR